MLKSLIDVSEYGYPETLEYKDVSPYSAYKGILVAVTDTRNNVLDNYLGKRSDADEILAKIIANIDSLTVVRATQLRDTSMVSVKFVYLPYKNMDCTKWKNTWELSNIEGYPYDACWINDVKVECVLSYNGLFRYIPLAYSTKNMGMLELLEETLGLVGTGIDNLMNDKEVPENEAKALNAFGLFKGRIDGCDALMIDFFNNAGENIKCDISGIDELRGIISSVRILEVKSRELDE